MKAKAAIIALGAVVIVLCLGFFNHSQLAAQTNCPDPNDPNIAYVSQDPKVCARIRFTCSGGQVPFSNACGCGCMGGKEACPDPKDPGVAYVSQDPNVCARVLFQCDSGSTSFSNHCGCGCLEAKGNSKCALAPTGICTKDINACGHASACQCPAGYTYDAAAGQCLLNLAGGASESGSSPARKQITTSASKCVVPPTGVCTDDINQCGNPSVCQCAKGFHYSPALGSCLKDLR